uniref:Laminin IV type B domain-containing protein n=1 Tax=Picea glauca TaxID=3330 RepID=A0A101LYK7_PICGL|nr:hypothetical protein ABT39_MTgene5951 [Picea glauca]
MLCTTCVQSAKLPLCVAHQQGYLSPQHPSPVFFDLLELPLPCAQQILVLTWFHQTGEGHAVQCQSSAQTYQCMRTVVMISHTHQSAISQMLLLSLCKKNIYSSSSVLHQQWGSHNPPSAR